MPTHTNPHPSPKKLLCVSVRNNCRKPQLIKMQMTLGAQPQSMSTTQPIHLGKYIRRGSRKIVRAKRTRMGCLLRDGIFCIWEGSWTQETSSMWLPKQDLKRWPLTCRWGLLFSILTVLVLSLYKGPRNPSVQTFHCSNNLESTLHVKMLIKWGEVHRLQHHFLTDTLVLCCPTWQPCGYWVLETWLM